MSRSRLFGSVVRTFDFYPGNRGSNPIRDVGFFSSYASFLIYEFSYSLDGGSSEMDHLSHIVIENDFLVIINDYSVEMGVSYVPLHHSYI